MFQRRTLLKGSIAAGALAVFPSMARAQKKVDAPFPIFDTHAHFYTNEPDKYPFQATNSRYGAEHMINKAMTNPMNPEAVFKFWEEGNIEMGTGVQYNSAYSTDNSYLLDCAEQYPARILSVVILDPVDPTTPDTLRRMTKENRITGVRFMGAGRGGYSFFTEESHDSWNVATELGLVVVLMPFGGNAMELLHEYATRYPNTNIVLDHMAFPNPQQYPETFGFSPIHHALAAHRNVYYKYTTFQLQETLVPQEVDLPAFMDYAVKLYGPDQFVWGSDIGNSVVDDIEYLQKALDSTKQMPYATRRAIFFDTAFRIFVPGGGSPVKHLK